MRRIQKNLVNVSAPSPERTYVLGPDIDGFLVGGACMIPA